LWAAKEHLAMQNRIHAIASAIVFVVLTTTAAAGAMAGDPDEGLAPARPRSVAPSGRRGRRPEVEKAKSVRPALAESLGAQLSPLPPDVEIKTRFVLAGRSRGETVVLGDDQPPPVTSRLVYSNTLGRSVFGPEGSATGLRMADDIVTTALGPVGDLNLRCCGLFCCDPEDETCCRRCNLDRYVIMVSGDWRGDGSGVGPFSVDVALYETCPGASVEPPVIEGTAAHVELPDNGTYLIVVGIPSGVDVPIPSSLYLGVSFGRENAGIVVGAPATVGLSANRFDFPWIPCGAGFGLALVPHASFYAQIYVRDECPSSFPGYRSSDHAQLSFNPGLQVRFADDITLGVPSCNLVAYEIAHKDNAILAVDLRTHLDANDPERGGVIEGTAGFLFFHDLDVEIGRIEVDPPIPLPQTFFVSFKSATRGGPIRTCRAADLGETSDQYWVYNGSIGAWVEEEATIGCWYRQRASSFDVTIYCEGLPPMGACCDMFVTDDRACVGGPNQGSPCSRNTDCRVCVGGANENLGCNRDADCPDGECPPSWVCVGESVCRELPEMNCASSLVGYEGLWTEGARCGAICIGGPADGRHCAADADCAVCVEGGRDGEPCCTGGACDTATGRCESGYRDRSVCCPGGACSTGTCEGSFCIGGDNDAQACTRQADCPGGTCEGGPFAHPCGVSTCCMPEDSDTCENLTEKQCLSIEPVERRRMYLKGSFCEAFNCPFNTCLQLEGDCLVAHPEPGCLNPFCCGPVCDVDPWCCQVEWDAYCLHWAQALCKNTRPLNDSCFNPDFVTRRALLMEANSSTAVSLVHASEDASDPGFGCHSSTPGAKGLGTVWFMFEATNESARIHTCDTAAENTDSLIQVFRASNPSTLETSCQSLEVIGCSDDEPDCVGGVGSDVCVTGLVPGDAYFILLAAKTDSARDVYELTLESPCPRIPPRVCLPGEFTWIDPPPGVVDARRPYPPGDPRRLEGIDALVALGPEGADIPECWSLCETGHHGWPNEIAGVVGGEDGTYTVILERPLSPGAVTRITYTDFTGSQSTWAFTAHPGNVRAGDSSYAGGISFLIAVLNGPTAPYPVSAPYGEYSTDCDHSGTTGPADILCLIDLLNGAFTRPWNGTLLPGEGFGCWAICDNVPCGKNEFCRRPCEDVAFCKYPDGTCFDSGSKGACTPIPISCPEDYEPICGCDGVTYYNECFSDAAGVSIDHRGACEP
jgi:hypothetical protein